MGNSVSRPPKQVGQAKRRKGAKIAAFLALLLLLIAPRGYGQQAERPYNRFQYHTFQWQAFHTSAFHIYFPKNCDSLCAFTASKLPGAIELVKKRMNISFQKEPNIIIYPSVDQLYESNIGGFEVQSYTLPTVVLKGTRILVAFSGSRDELGEQLRTAIARAAWEEQFNTGLGDQLKGTVSDQDIPSWFKEGAIKYFAAGWTIRCEDALLRSFEQNHFTDWYQVLSAPARAGTEGAAFCYFLSRQYYPEAVAQLFAQLRKKKSLPRAIRLIAKKPLDSLYADCFLFYKNRFSRDGNPDTTSREITTIPLAKGTFRSALLSPDENYLAYIMATPHKRTVWIYDRRTQRKYAIASYRLPPWLDDHAADVYPLIAWHGNGKDLLVALPVKGKIMVRQYGVTGAKIREHTLFGVDGLTRILSPDQQDLLLSAFRKGQSDIVLYNERKERYTAITDDRYDDSEPAKDSQSGQTWFISKRKLKKQAITRSGKDSLYWAQGIFRSKNGTVAPVVTDTLEYMTWDNPVIMGNGTVLATHTRFGQERFALVDEQSGMTTLSRYRPFQLNTSGNTISFFSSGHGAGKDSLTITRFPFDAWQQRNTALPADTSSPWLEDYRKDAADRAREDSLLKAAAGGEPSFLEGVLVPKNAKERSQRRRDSILQSLQYDPERIKPYLIQLHSAYFTARANNDYFINRYQPFLNYQGQFKFPEAGGMARGGFTDLFENHHFSIAYRLPAGTEGSDFFVRYENTKKKNDWSLLWFRKVESLQPDPLRNWKDENGNPYPNSAKVKTNYYEFSVSKPLTYYLSLTFSTAIRDDRTIFLATEKYSLKFEDIKSTWSVSTASARWNKLQPTLPFLFKGFKAKLLLDFFKGFSQQKLTLYGMGLDLQYHQPVWRYITAVGRVQAGQSGGDSKLLYNMGGVDNNLTIRTDTGVYFPQNAPYAFQTLITPLRGYLQNELYGNRYALFNADVYFPLFQSLIPIETPLQSLNLLQPGLLMDLAYTDESWKNNRQNVLSFGWSLRTNLAGYNLRADMAWPGSFNKKPVWYLSLSLQ